MNIQSLSIVVPTGSCINDCAFCVSKMHHEDYGANKFKPNSSDFAYTCNEYKKRMAFARDNGCNVVMLTGTAEPTQNKSFLSLFAMLNRQLESPFRHISIQTAGALLDEDYLKFLKHDIEVNTVSLSISSFDNDINAEYHRAKVPVDIAKICKSIKDLDFNLRLSLNLTDSVAQMPSVQSIFSQAQALNADQLTFRVLYASGDTPQAKWIEKRGANRQFIDAITEYVQTNGRKLERLEYGQIRYDIHDISTVIDDDCMSVAFKDEIKYLILRPNAKLYTKWDSKASLLF